MLRSLHIKDFAIIDELDCELSPGLNVLTGETGAGKTIIVEALKLVLGGRADAGVVRAGEERASVTAIFDSRDILPDSLRALEESGVNCKEDIVITRIVGGQGKGRISINGVPMAGSMLKGMGVRLVDVSNQHEHQMLLNPSWHGEILDEFGGFGRLAADYRNAQTRFADAERELSELKAKGQAAKEKTDFLKFQLDELAAAALKAGEEDAIEAERMKLKNASALEERARAAEGALYGAEGSAVETIDRALFSLVQCEQFDATISIWRESVGKARVEIEDVARELSRYAEKLESNPVRLEELDERLHLIRRLVRKHGGTVAACIAKQLEIATELGDALSYDETLVARTEELGVLALERRKVAGEWSRERIGAAEKMGKSVAVELAGLGMGKAGFRVSVKERPEAEWDEGGPNSVEFLIAPNVGEPPKALARIASGGELSRAMLAIKSALAGRGNFAATSVFDEVDSGIGGAIAAVVGKKLKDVARSRQVICITHLPQVAVHGDRHILISKRVKGGRTVAFLKTLLKEERVREIARMLSGDRITDTTFAHAEEMLKNATV
ncbi:MAG: DNA repair protein RecN [Pseudomonadota bacterium]